MNRIAISGPDGAGKTTICTLLASRLKNTRIIYGGKNRGHQLSITPPTLRLYHRCKALSPSLGCVIRYFIFYPVEYIENLYRFNQTQIGKDEILLYDRHPIDRVMMPYALRLRWRAKDISNIRFAVEILPAMAWSVIYRYAFPKVGLLCVLLPDPDIAFDRSNGQYQSLEESHIRVNAYKDAAKILSRKTNVQTIFFNRTITANEIADSVIKSVTTDNN